MYLKKLEIQGFKSFVDKMSLNFGNGITAIVGPNGSGKSNISDAIRWVMGEQSVKSLRGSKMEDVIFSGTDKRKPTGFAEVSLHLDNSSKIFPIDYEDVVVTRRVYRSGESEYFINKAACRLRDIHELFMDTGLGRDGYSVIGQGKIDEVLSGKPEERRQIFEEAAGISKYKYKKAEAERRLFATEDNLSRISDIASELETRLDPLKKQSEKAIRYLTLRDELKVLDVNLALISIDETKAERLRLEDTYANTLAQADAETKLLARYRSDEDAAYSDIRETEDEISRIKEVLHKSEIIKEKINGEIQLMLNNIGLYGDEIKKSTENIEMLEQDIKSALAENEKNLSQIKKLEEERDKITNEIEQTNSEIITISGETDNKNTALSELVKEFSEHTRKADGFKNKIETLSAIDANFDNRISALQASENEMRQNAEKSQRLAEEYGKAAEKCRFECIDAEKNISEQKQKSEILIREISSLKASYNEKSDACNKCRTRLDVLSDMEKNMEGYGHGVKALISSDFIKTLNVHGLLSKLISTADEYCVAVETALAGALQNIVVNSEDDAKKAIAYLKEKHLGRVTFLPLSSMTGKRGKFEDDIKKDKGSLGLLSDKVECKPIYRETVENFLGQTALFDNIDNAAAAAKKYKYSFKIITLEGDLFFPGGSITGGSTSRNARLLGRGAEIKKLSSECTALERSMDKLEDKIDKANEDLKTTMNTIEELKENIQRKNSEIVRLSGEIELQKRISERDTDEANKRHAELELLLEAGRNSEKERKLLSENAKSAENAAAALQEQINLIQSDIRTLREKREALSSSVTEKKMKISDINGSAELCRMKMNTIISETNLKKERIKILENNISELTEKSERTRLQIQNRQTDIAETEDKNASLTNEILKMSEKRKSADKDITNLKSALTEQNERVNSLKLELTRLEGKIEKYTEKFDSTIEMLWNDYELSYSDALALKNDIGNINDAKKHAAHLKAQIKNLGHINIDAIEEYKEVSKRYDFLSSQTADLRRAKSELTSLIAEVTEAMKTQFAQQFDIISKNFSEVFRELFGGGSAALSLSEPTNILESGIDIDVRPPGKKLQRLSLLSGGEMAFTAIALLFAILKVHPTPFCILDEIEAALDDNNIARFCNYIKDFSKTTQFIVITHRRGTMEAADILYGVTMQEKGISKLLTMKLSEVKFK